MNRGALGDVRGTAGLCGDFGEIERLYCWVRVPQLFGWTSVSEEV